MRATISLASGLVLALMVTLTMFAAPVMGNDMPAATFDLSDTDRVAAGKLRFGTSCAAYCHGSDGTGGKAPSLKGRADFDPGYAFQIITKGRRGAAIMPPWGKAYTPEEIWELVAYLQYLAKQDPNK